MRQARRKYTFLLLVSLLVASDAGWASSLTQQIAHCAQLTNNQQRLACYDSLTHAQEQADHANNLHPPESFLDSRLVAVAWKPEYTLTVRKFVALIHKAVMGNHKKIKVHGWHRDERHYILNITMRSAVSLRFLPRDRKATKLTTKPTTKPTMSLLKEVEMDGTTVDAAQFIMTIAAMVPDK
jgi:hypothetical protein